MRAFSTQDCAFCYVSQGVITGCNPKRSASAEAKCSKCKSKLPPRGSILNIRYLEVSDSKGERVGSGFMMKVLRESDQKEDWYLCHVRGGRGSKLFPLIGCNGTRLKEIFAEQDLVAAWPAGHHSEIVPFR